MNQSSRLAIKLSFQSSCQGSQAVIVQGGKKSVFLVKKAITHLKSNRKGKSWCVSENSVYMLQAYMTKLLHVHIPCTRRPQTYHTSSGQASKDGRFEDALYMEYALMQQPSHMLQDGH